MSYQHANDDLLDVDDDFIIEDDTPSTNNAQNTTSVGSEQLVTRRFMGGDTLDEPVLRTLGRDLRGVGNRLKEVVWPGSLSGFINPVDNSSQLIKEWDLWGPLVFCLVLALSLGWGNGEAFSGVFAITWMGQILVTLNIKLLGGNISFFRGLCIVGYSLFPVVLGSVVEIFIPWIWLSVPVVILNVAWALWSANNSLKHSGVLPGRSILASYPVGLFFVSLGWLCILR